MATLLLLAAALTAQQPVSTPGPTDVAAAIQSEFPARDLNGDGTLSRAEFGAWLAELKAKGTRARADAPATRAWVTAAFTLADQDGNAGVTEGELTGFFTAARS